MKSDNFYEKAKRKTIAIVYIFEGEEAIGFEHYHVWESDIIAPWLLAVQQLHCIPLILDVRTFVEKAISNTLPKIDFVVNLNCGSTLLSSMPLVPSICSFIGIPCIPCDSYGIVTGENKKTSNILAKNAGFLVPADLNPSDKNGIYKPLNLGSSIGVHREFLSELNGEGIYQEFIPGFDITIPMIYNPVKEEMDFMPAIIYIPESKDISWFLDEDYANLNNKFQRYIVHNLSDSLTQSCRKLATDINLNTFCRIDARLKKEHYDLDLELTEENTYFLEINPMPTVSTENAFFHSYSAINEQDQIYESINKFRNIIGGDSVHAFVLWSSILSFYSHVQK